MRIIKTNKCFQRNAKQAASTELQNPVDQAQRPDAEERGERPAVLRSASEHISQIDYQPSTGQIGVIGLPDEDSLAECLASGSRKHKATEKFR